MRENFVLHKLHSLTGIIPVGFYMVQHLTLNSFSIAGPGYFNNVVKFFEAMPWWFLLGIELFGIWLPLFFHAIYGLFIWNRADSKTVARYSKQSQKYKENSYFKWQRWTGVLLFFFIIAHMFETTFRTKITHDPESFIYFEAWATKLAQPIVNGTGTYLVLALYLVFVAMAAYHLGYGIWNFCIRWGITVSDKAQANMAKFAGGATVALTLLGWAALAGFLIPRESEPLSAQKAQPVMEAAASVRED